MTPIQDESGLLPCPFCGSREVDESIGTKRDSDGNEIQWPYIECDNCAASAEPDVWNRRSAPRAGFVEVPVEPTVEMFNAAYQAYLRQTRENRSLREYHAAIYKAMLAASAGRKET